MSLAWLSLLRSKSGLCAQVQKGICVALSLSMTLVSAPALAYALEEFANTEDAQLLAEENQAGESSDLTTLSADDASAQNNSEQAAVQSVAKAAVEEDRSTRTILFRANGPGDTMIPGFALTDTDDYAVEITNGGRYVYLTARNAFTMRMPGCALETYTSKEGYVYQFVGWSTWSNANLVNSSGSRTLYAPGQEILWSDVAASANGLYAAWSQIGYASNDVSPAEPTPAQQQQSCKAIVFALLKPSAVNAHPGITKAEGQAGVVPVEPATYSNSYYMRPYAVWSGAKMSELLKYVKRAEMKVDPSGVDAMLTDGFWAKLAEQNTKSNIPSSDSPQNIISPVDGKRYNFYDPNTQRIVWYVIKEQTDGWHIDGIVVDKKNWTLTYSANCPDSNNWLPLGPVMTEGSKAIVSSVTSSKPQGNSYVTKTLTRPGYEFIGWNTKADGTGQMYHEGDAFANESGAEGHVLYAQWRYISGTLGISVSTDSHYGSNGLLDVALSQEAVDAGYELMYSVDERGKKNDTWTPWTNNATPEEPKKEGPQLNAGDYTVRLKGEQQETHQSTEVRSVDVTVDPAKLVVDIPSASKVYDGTPLVAAYSLDNLFGLQNDETAGLWVEGEITEVGEIEMMAFVLFAADDNDYTALEQNYDVEMCLGTLSISEAPLPPAEPEHKPIITNPEQPTNPDGSNTPSDPIDVTVPGAEGLPVEEALSELLPAVSALRSASNLWEHDSDAFSPSSAKRTTLSEEYVPDSENPLAKAGKLKAPGFGCWALINLLCALFTLACAMYETATYKRQEKEDKKQAEKLGSKKEVKRRSMHVVLCSGVIAACSAILFLLTEDMTLPMALIDIWTLAMAVLAILSVCTLSRKTWSRKSRRKPFSSLLEQ